MKHWHKDVTLWELIAETWREVNEDRVWGRAAELAYYFLFALFPMLIFVVSLVGFLPGLREELFQELASLVPGEAMQLINETITDVVRNRHSGLLSFGILGAVWAASGGVTAVMDSLNIAYDVKEERAFWKVRLLAIGMTLLLALLIVGATALLMVGGQVSERLAQQSGGTGWSVVWRVLETLIGMAELFLGLQLIYYFGPNIRQSWRWITPGAVFAVLSLVTASLLFSLYLRVAPNYSATYGSLGAVIVLLLWLYFAGAVILIGGEVNAALARLSGKAMMQKEPPAKPAANRTERNSEDEEAGIKPVATATPNTGSPTRS